MEANKHIERDGQQSNAIFDSRSLKVDYRHLTSILSNGIRVLDVGCGTGAISKDIAEAIGPMGKVIGIDNTEKFIESGKLKYRSTVNLELHCVDLFHYQPSAPFDLITSARVLQWLNNPVEALIKMKQMLKPGGTISILDYNHEALEWQPAPPDSMKTFYKTFLEWRNDAQMSNRMAEELPEMFDIAGFSNVQVLNSDEYYDRSRQDFIAKAGIWSKVAASTQMVDEGYLDNDLRLQAIAEYDEWIANEAVSMTMKLNEVRGIKT